MVARPVLPPLLQVLQVLEQAEPGGGAPGAAEAGAAAPGAVLCVDCHPHQPLLAACTHSERRAVRLWRCGAGAGAGGPAAAQPMEVDAADCSRPAA